MNKNVFVFLANGFEEIEAVTIIDLLRRAEISVTTVSISDTLIVDGGHGIKVIADILFDDVENFDSDMLILPGGGLGTKNLKMFRPLSKLLIEYNKENKNLAAICAAPSVLGVLNILENKKSCCYPGFESELLKSEVVFETVVRDKNIITSRGAGTAIDFAIKIIEVLKNKELALEIKAQIISNN